MQPETAGRARASGGARLKRRRSCNRRRGRIQIHGDADMRDGMARRVEAGCTKKKKDFGQRWESKSRVTFSALQLQESPTLVEKKFKK